MLYPEARREEIYNLLIRAWGDLFLAPANEIKIVWDTWELLPDDFNLRDKTLRFMAERRFYLGYIINLNKVLSLLPSPERANFISILLVPQRWGRLIFFSKIIESLAEVDRVPGLQMLLDFKGNDFSYPLFELFPEIDRIQALRIITQLKEKEIRFLNRGRTKDFLYSLPRNLRLATFSSIAPKSPLRIIFRFIFGLASDQSLTHQLIFSSITLTKRQKLVASMPNEFLIRNFELFVSFLQNWNSDFARIMLGDLFSGELFSFESAETMTVTAIDSNYLHPELAYNYYQAIEALSPYYPSAQMALARLAMLDEQWKEARTYLGNATQGGTSDAEDARVLLSRFGLFSSKATTAIKPYDADEYAIVPYCLSQCRRS